MNWLESRSNRINPFEVGIVAALRHLTQVITTGDTTNSRMINENHIVFQQMRLICSQVKWAESDRLVVWWLTAIRIRTGQRSVQFGWTVSASVVLRLAAPRLIQSLLLPKKPVFVFLNDIDLGVDAYYRTLWERWLVQWVRVQWIREYRRHLTLFLFVYNRQFCSNHCRSSDLILSFFWWQQDIKFYYVKRKYNEMSIYLTLD